MSDALTVGDLAPDTPIYVTTNRSGSTRLVHLSDTCQHLKAASNPIVEKRPPMYYDDLAVCATCRDGGSGGGTDLSTYTAARDAGRGDD